jgi:hypothetical protein
MKWEDKKAACKPGVLIESHPNPHQPGTIELRKGMDTPFVTRSGRRVIKENRWVVLERKPGQAIEDAGGMFWHEKYEDEARDYLKRLLEEKHA